MKNILVAVDFSDVSADLLETARSFAQAFGSRIYLLHVADPNPDFVGFEAGPESVRHQEAAELRHEHRELQELADRLRSGGTEVTALVIQGPTVEKIIEEIDKLGAELVIMGAHHHSAWQRFFVGSTSDGVLKAERCPVLIVPERKERS